jgi:hypothetical protein
MLLVLALILLALPGFAAKAAKRAAGLFCDTRDDWGFSPSGESPQSFPHLHSAG